MIIYKYMRITRILFILLSITLCSAQTAEELKRFMDTYDKIKVDQEANEVVKKGLDSEKNPEDGPVRLIIEPGNSIIQNFTHTKRYLPNMSFFMIICATFF